MSIDLGDTPVGTPPNGEQKSQICLSIGALETSNATDLPTIGNVAIWGGVKDYAEPIYISGFLSPYTGFNGVGMERVSDVNEYSSWRYTAGDDYVALEADVSGWQVLASLDSDTTFAYWLGDLISGQLQEYPDLVTNWVGQSGPTGSSVINLTATSFPGIGGHRLPSGNSTLATSDDIPVYTNVVQATSDGTIVSQNPSNPFGSTVSMSAGSYYGLKFADSFGGYMYLKYDTGFGPGVTVPQTTFTLPKVYTGASTGYSLAVLPQGPYTNDSAAAAAGIPSGWMYYTADGSVKVRLV